MKNVFLISLFLISFNFLYSQEKFKHIFFDEEFTEYLLRIEKKENDKVFLWLKTEYSPEAVKDKNGKYISKRRGYRLDYIIINIKDKIYSSLDNILYDSNNEIVSHVNLNIIDERIIPDSIIDIIYMELLQ